MDTTLKGQDEQYIASVAEGVHRHRSTIMSDEMFYFVMSINMGIICQTVVVFGIISNIINIIVFIKQGFTDAVNISLLSLAISDLFALLFLLWTNLCYTSSFRLSAFPLVTDEIQVISGGWPHIAFTRITGWITVFISMERCICVTRPLQVKTIFTHKRHVISMVTIFLVTFLCSALAYVFLGIDWKFYSEKNMTLIGLVERFDYKTARIMDCIDAAIVGVFMPITCFFSVLVFTVFLIVKLKQQAAWRSASSFMIKETPIISSSNVTLSTRDQKVTKMIVFISSVFIICYIPAVVSFIATYVEPELGYTGFYRNIFMSIMYSSIAAVAFNSSINIFVYVGMSTKYRQVFYILFRDCLNVFNNN